MKKKKEEEEEKNDWGGVYINVLGSSTLWT